MTLCKNKNNRNSLLIVNNVQCILIYCLKEKLHLILYYNKLNSARRQILYGKLTNFSFFSDDEATKKKNIKKYVIIRTILTNCLGLFLIHCILFFFCVFFLCICRQNILPFCAMSSVHLTSSFEAANTLEK
jgi:hypothetical protein